MTFLNPSSVLNIYGKFFVFVIAISAITFANAKTIFIPSTYQYVTPTSQLHHEVTDTFTTATPATVTQSNQDIVLGPCIWAIGRTCPDKDVAFYLYSRRNPKSPQRLIVYGNGTSNLSESFFDKRYPTKIVLHGFNADMFLHALQMIKSEYLALGEYNIIYVDWSKLALGLCYMNAVHNIRHVGSCVAQLVKNIIDEENLDIHIIGFSLGAQLANHIAKNLGTFRLPRITGLDPALPLFITSSNDDKLDASDAVYVDVIHTNALVQGKFEQCGHSDAYMNGGVFQPNCMEENTLNPFPCFHHRAIEYYIESIGSEIGFWAWPCSSYLSYLLGLCPPSNNWVEVGANVKNSTMGMYFVDTNGKSPYAMGKWTNSSKYPANAKTARSSITITQPPQKADPILRRIDQWGKLDYDFNNLDKQEPTPYSQDPYGENWSYFNEDSSDVSSNSVKVLNDKQGDFEREQYKRNLSLGIIENSLVGVPVLKV